MVFMKIAVFLNPTKPGIFEYAKEVVQKLINLGVDVSFYEDYGQESFGENVCWNKNIVEFVKYCDIILTIGGDGTIIHMAKYAAKYSKLILGINFGRVGFVTELERNETDKLERLARGEYEIQERSLLEVLVYKNGCAKEFLAVNDAVICRGENTKIIDISARLNSKEVCHYRADGLIMATATGSTAYSMSAGGPIISPELNCVLFTPICSHSMFSRPIVFSGDKTLDIYSTAKDFGNISLSIDGKNALNLTDFDKISVRSAKQKVKLITFSDRSFYKRVSEKLMT